MVHLDGVVNGERFVCRQHVQHGVDLSETVHLVGYDGLQRLIGGQSIAMSGWVVALDRDVDVARAGRVLAVARHRTAAIGGCDSQPDEAHLCHTRRLVWYEMLSLGAGMLTFSLFIAL